MTQSTQDLEAFRAEVRAWLAQKGHDPRYGARPLARVIQESIKKPLADELLLEKGIKVEEAREAMRNPNYFGAMMVAMHQADGVISGAYKLGEPGPVAGDLAVKMWGTNGAGADFSQIVVPFYPELNSYRPELDPDGTLPLTAFDGRYDGGRKWLALTDAAFPSSGTYHVVVETPIGIVSKMVPFVK